MKRTYTARPTVHYYEHSIHYEGHPGVTFKHLPDWWPVPPRVREFDVRAGGVPLIPPAALTLILFGRGEPWFASIDGFVQWVKDRKSAKLLLRMFSLRDPIAWCFFIGSLINPRTRPPLLRALGLMKWVDENYTGKQTGVKSTPAAGAGKTATTA